LRRGFKAQAERNAAAARAALGLAEVSPLDPWEYAAHLDVIVLDFETLGLEIQVVRQLTKIDASSWSAMTLQDGNAFAIVINPAHAKVRQRSDLMHELSHILLRHIPARVEVAQSKLLLLSDYSDEQEQEADWQGASLLLPRDALVHLRMRNKTTGEIAEHFGVSTALCEWRLRMTGVDVQMRRSANS
jgi:Zn-dependent peptidase ImmA (M78 family)